MEFAILGPLEVVDAGAAVALGALKTRSLLALFLLNANEWLSSDRLIEELWSGDPPERAPAVLQVHVANLRKALEPRRARGEASRRLVTHAGGYRLPVEPDELDWLKFERGATDGREALARGDAARADGALRDALALWRGPLLADLSDEPFVSMNAARFDEARVAAYELRIDAGLALARHHELVGELERAVVDHPLRERLWGQLMLALYRSGRQADALRTFGKARAVLVDELGIEPGPELQAFERALLEQDPELAPPPSPSAVAAAGPRRRAPLPQSPNRLVGRDDDVDAVAALLTDPGTRLVTVTGAGGIGKSRLAIAAAARAESGFSDGVVFVWLAAVTEPHLVGPAIARALDVDELPGPTVVDTLRAALADLDLLLVLDNFEHLLAAAPEIGELLAGAPGLRVLATSRSPLRIAAEQEYELAPLPLPALEAGATLTPMQVAACGAVELFVERARAARRSFELTPENAGVVARICTALDGLPLAIELAAARTRVLAPDALLERLGRRLDLLTGGARDAPSRQRTLRATIEWSYDLLTDDERRLFLWLGVFSGWFELHDVEVVCADALGASLPDATTELVDLLASLVEQSLVRPGTGAAGGRFAMFQTVREFALEQLAAARDADRAARRHREHFLGLALDAHAAANGAREAESFARLDAATDNVQVALASAAEHDGETFERLCTALGPWWSDRAKYTEAAHWTGLALARDDLVVSGELVMNAGVFASRQDDFATAIPLLQRARGALEVDDPARAADCLTYLGEIAVLQGELDAAGKHAASALALATEAGDGTTARYASYLLGWVAEERGDVDEARRRFDEDLEIARANDVPAATAHALATIAELDVLADDLDAAEQRIATARAQVGREGGNAQFRSYAHRIDGFVALGRGDGARAVKEFSAALDAARELGRTLEATWCLGGLASAAVLTGDAALGARLFSAAHQLRTGAGAAEPLIERRRYEPYLVAAREALGAETFDAYWSGTRVNAVADALGLLSGNADRAR